MLEYGIIAAKTRMVEIFLITLLSNLKIGHRYFPIHINISSNYLIYLSTIKFAFFYWYIVMHTGCEDLIRESGIPYTIVRPCALIEEPAGADLISLIRETIYNSMSINWKIF